MVANSHVLYDRDIREPLFDFIEEEYGKIRILEEKRTDRLGIGLLECVPYISEGAVAIEVAVALYYICKNPVRLPDYFHFQLLFRQILKTGDSEQSRFVNKSVLCLSVF